jgi:hypothetical protein
VYTKVRHWPASPPFQHRSAGPDGEAGLCKPQQSVRSRACCAFKYAKDRRAVKLVGWDERLGGGGGGGVTGRYVGQPWPATGEPIATLCVAAWRAISRIILLLIKQLFVREPHN